MKRLFLISTLLLVFTSCEDVVNIDLEDPDSRLVVDALLRIDSSLPENPISIRLTLSSNFFTDNTPVNNALVSLTNQELNQTLPLTPEGSDGNYNASIATDFLSSGTIELRIDHEGNSYTATNSFVPSTPILKLEQGDGELFNEEDIEIVIGYKDREAEENYYLFDFDKGKFFTSEDTFYPNQEFEFSFFHDTAVPGDTLEVTILGADRELIKYMEQILTLSGEAGLTPFQTPVTTARGNIIGPDDNFDTYTLGYFALLEAFSQPLIIE